MHLYSAFCVLLYTQRALPIYTFQHQSLKFNLIFSQFQYQYLNILEGVNDCFLDHCQVSSLPYYCGFKEQDIPGIYTVWMVIN